jgi:predicted nucleic acid-binding protein
MIDSNVLISAIFNKASTPALAVQRVSERHRFLLCSYIVDECRGVLLRKFPEYVRVFEDYLREINYEVAPGADCSGAQLSDPKDQPILDAALQSGVEVLISGDRHFLALDLDNLLVKTPADFLAFDNP